MIKRKQEAKKQNINTRRTNMISVEPILIPISFFMASIPCLLFMGLIYLLWLGKKNILPIWKVGTAKNEKEYREWEEKYNKKHGIKTISMPKVECVLRKHNLNKGTKEELLAIYEKTRPTEKKIKPGTYKVEF